MTTDDPLRLALVGPDPLARSGLAALLSGRAGVEVVAQLTPGEVESNEALYDVDVLCFDAVSFQAGQALPVVPELPTLALVVHEDAARELRDAGAVGVIRRDGDAHRLVRAAEAVARGLVIIDEVFAEALLRPRRPVVEEGDLLSPREVEVLELLAEGLSNREIGVELGISRHTAKFHVQGILDKMDAVTRTEAVVRALRMGFLRL